MFDELTEELRDAIMECDLEKSNLNEVLDAIEDSLKANYRENYGELKYTIFFNEDGNFSYEIVENNEILLDVMHGESIVVAIECVDVGDDSYSFYDSFIEPGCITEDNIAAMDKHIKSNKKNKEYYKCLLNDNEELDAYDEDGEFDMYIMDFTDFTVARKFEELFAEVFTEAYDIDREYSFEPTIDWVRERLEEQVYDTWREFFEEDNE